MRNRIYVILVGIAFGLAAGGVSHAMSDLMSISLEPVWPDTSNPGTVITYKVTVTRTGQGILNVSLSSLGLPEGATASFFANPVRFTGRVPETLTSTLTITCPSVMPTDTSAFTVTGKSFREAITVTNQPPAELLTGSSRLPMLALDLPGTTAAKLRGTGDTGAIYQVEATADLINPSWTPIGLSTADGNGRFMFLDAQAKDLPARFYRTLLLSPAAAAVANQ